MIILGNEIEVSESYYHTLSNNLGQILIRVSNHGTYLKTWINRYDDPTKSLQNLSIIFSDGPITSNTEIEKSPSGELVYFVVEQYLYRIDNISKKDFIKIINQLKKLEDDLVFLDPLKKKVKKRANRQVLTPIDVYSGNPVPSTKNPVSARQTIVAKNKYKEVDKDGNVLEHKKKKTLIITEQQYNDLINKSFRTLLTEDQTSSSIRDARNLLMKTYGWDKEHADKFIRIDLRNDLPSLRSKQGR